MRRQLARPTHLNASSLRPRAALAGAGPD
jgi:hypothetical protein